MTQRRHIFAVLGLLLMAWPAPAVATQPCEPIPPTHYAPLPEAVELSTDAEQVCGLPSDLAMSAYGFEVIGPDTSPDRTQIGRPYLLELEGGGHATWIPGHSVEQPWMVEQAVSIRPISLADSGEPLASTETRHCYTLPTLAPGDYLVISDAAPDAPTHNVMTELRIADRPADPRPSANLERIEAREAQMACSEHGYFVASMGDKPDGVWAYTWTVRDAQGRVVQEGVGLEPRAAGQATTVDGEFSMGPFHGTGATERPYILGQQYEMEVRAVGFDGQRSEPTHGQFVFEQTGEGSSFVRLAVGALLGCTTLFIGALMLLVWALSRRTAS